MSSANAIDLSLLPPPEVLEALSFETTFTGMVTLVQTGVPGVFEGIPDFDGTIESDPAVKVLQVAAYCRLLDRARVNAAARAVMVAYATGDDLVNLGALFEVEKLDGETDDAYRERIVLAPDGFSVAGPEAAYTFHARSASTLVKDARPISPSPGDVVVTVLSTAGDGTANDALLDLVEAALTPTEVRPMTDNVTVQSAEIVNYTVDADLYLFEGPDGSVVLANAIAGRDAYIDRMRRIGRDVTKTGLIASMFVEGVQRLVLNAPVADVVCDDTQAAHCTARATRIAGTGE